MCAAMALLYTVTLGLVASIVAGKATPLAPKAGFHVDVKTNGSYDVLVDGVTWLPSGPTFFNNGGQRYCTGEGTLKLVGHESSQGNDKFGQWNTTTFSYKAGDLSVKTSVKLYTDPALPVAVFSQSYTSAATKTKGKHPDDIISSFPSFRFRPDLATPLGYIAYGNDMAGWVSLSLGRWTAAQANFSTGIRGGPLVIFDENSNVLVISPLSKFMAASNRKFGDKHVSWGIMGMVDSVPEDYSVDFVVYYGGRGINEAMCGWGEYMRKLYNKTSKYRDNDLSLTHMGYWTDNGAYYYYNKQKGKNYEDTLLDVAAYLKKQLVPVKYLEIDMFFYPKGNKDGTKTWAPMQSEFPNGFKYLYEKTGLPIACHNKFWANDTTYASYNGGKYNFISDKITGRAVPDDQQFWIDLFASTQEWGKFMMYEQDFLNTETDRNHVLLSDLDLGRRWLTQMGEGAAKSGVTIQYCMSYSRHILQSLEVPVATQARVSDDYMFAKDQWKVGITSMFTDAVNLAPSKDNFWSTKKQPGNPYNTTEPQPYLQALVATLSTGPVGVGDGIGYVSKDLLMKCCDGDGRILRGSRPLTAMDKSLKQAAYEGTGPDGRGEVLYSTISNITGHIFGTIVASQVVGTYKLGPTDLTPDYPPVPEFHTTYLYQSYPDPSGNYTVMKWSEGSLEINPNICGSQACVLHSAPSFKSTYSSVALLGELGSKFSPVSPQRFSRLLLGSDGSLKVEARLAAGEKIDVWFLIEPRPNELFTAKVVCSNSKETEPADFVASIDGEGIINYCVKIDSSA